MILYSYFTNALQTRTQLHNVDFDLCESKHDTQDHEKHFHIVIAHFFKKALKRKCYSTGKWRVCIKAQKKNVFVSCKAPSPHLRSCVATVQQSEQIRDRCGRCEVGT